MPPKINLPFHCDLCHKSYARISELETHESSYDHHHRKRAADLRIANRDSNRRKREEENHGVIRVLGEDTDRRPSSKKLKRGFKSAFDGSDKLASMNDKMSPKGGPTEPKLGQQAKIAKTSDTACRQSSGGRTSPNAVGG